MDTEPTSLSLIVRLASDSIPGKRAQPSPDDKEIKVLQRTRVSHLLKTISPAFGGYIEKDFDAYLIHTDMDIALNTTCRLSDYNCKNQDVIELRRKEQIITLGVNIYADEVREYQVNASLPVYEIVKFLGTMLNVENTKELSLALPSSSEKMGVSISHLNWLDVTRSLNSQGIEDGDMVLLRKKFFIFNEDIQEAEQNTLLRDIIYHQLKIELVHAKAEKKRRASNDMTLSHLSSGSDRESSSDEALVESPGLLHSVIQAFEAVSERTLGDTHDSSLTDNCTTTTTTNPTTTTTDATTTDATTTDATTTDATTTDATTTDATTTDATTTDATTTNTGTTGSTDIVTVYDESHESLQKTLSRHQSHFTANFEVTLSNEEKTMYLCFQSSNILLSEEPQVTSTTTVIKKWSVNELDSWDKTDKGLTLKFKEEWHTLFSDHHSRIADYLAHMKSVMGEGQEESSPIHQPFQLNTELGESGNSASSTPASTPMKKKTPSVTLSLVDSMNSSSESIHQQEPNNEEPIITGGQAEKEEGEEEAGIGSDIPINSSTLLSNTSEGATALVDDDEIQIVSSPSHKPRRERKTNITPPSYFGKGYKDLVDEYLLIHVNVLDQEIREILVSCTDPVRLVIRDICATFDIQYPEDHYLRLPITVEEIINSYGGKPKKGFDGSFEKTNAQKQPNVVLDGDISLLDQMDINLKPYVFVLKRIGQDETDAAEKYSLDIGQEWPDGEDPGVARYRLFYQSWIGIIQGDYPITKSTAVRLAALLTYVYHGSRASAGPYWPPPEYNVKFFLPEIFYDSFGIESDVLKAHKKIDRVMTLNQAIDTVIQLCKDIPSSCGLYFQIKVPSSGTLRKKMETRTFGLKRDGLVCFGKGLKQVCWNQRYTEISDWAISNSSFHLKFNSSEVDDLYAYSYQSRQIMELMQTYVKMQYKEAQEKKAPLEISDV